MKRYWNNKGRIIFSVVFLVFCSTLLALCFLLPDKANSGPYLSSAHGSTSYGVNRSSLSTFGYSKGNCAHCHEQHASIGGSEPAPTGGPSKWCLLATNFSGKTTKSYAQGDNVCFYCHIVTGTYQSPSFYNYSYSYTFGGATGLISPNNIFAAFNGFSYHNLYDVWRLITGLYGSKTFTSFPAGSNPCSGCHNIHIAKRNKAYPGNPTYTAISKPSDHSNLWGDDSPGERMTAPAYGDKYQPPRYYNSTNLEPDNASSDRAIQAAKTPDYITFCTNCHINTENSVWSTTLNRWLRPIDWSSNGDRHGNKDASGDSSRDAPYNYTKNFVLTCTDCHEPHGSPSIYLLRKEVNGGEANDVTNYNGGTQWSNWCDRCHPYKNHMGGVCIDCHYHGSYNF